MIDVEDVTTKAVCAALDVIDQHTNGATNTYFGPCGDVLAAELHEIISKAIKSYCDGAK